MADVKDTVATHISDNWTGTVVGGSGSTPTIDAVGPEDIVKPEDYPEAVLVYNEKVSWDRTFAQNQYGDRHTRVFILVTAHTKSGCTKTHFRAFIDELKAVFGSAISGYDVQLLDEPENVTRSRGVGGDGMYQASFVLHLWEYGISTSSAAAGGAAGTTIWAEPFVTYQASANLSAERVLAMSANNTLSATLTTFALTPAVDSTYDIGANATRYANIYCDTLYATNLGASMNIGDFALTNVDELQNDEAIKIQPSGDTDDYIKVYTSSNTCYIEAVGAPLVLRSSTANVKIQPDGDSDDYIEFSVDSGVRCDINRVGGDTILFSSGDATWVKFNLYEGSSANMLCGWNKSSDYGSFTSKGPIRFYADADTDDYIYFTTASNVVSLVPDTDDSHTIGTAALAFDEMHAYDFVDKTPSHLDKDAVTALTAITAKADGDLNHQSLPDYIRREADEVEPVFEDQDEEELETGKRITVRRQVGYRKTGNKTYGRSLSGMVSLLTKAVQQLTARIEELEAAQAQPIGSGK